jgi:hypothetical protein
MIKKILSIMVISFILMFSGPIYLLSSNQVKLGQDLRIASRAPANLLSIKKIGTQAAIILFSAPAFNWRGMFSTHTWLALKHKNQVNYTIYQVIGWNRYRDKPIVDVSHGVADKLWYGIATKIDGRLIGTKAEILISAVKIAVSTYPYANHYRAWPGPNSNTFIAYIIKQVPELHFTIPYNALGRNYGWHWTMNSLSLGGLFGYHFSHRVITINFLGLTFGFSFKSFGLIVPGVGLIRLINY